MIRFHTSFKLHQKVLKVRWYRDWHKPKYAHHYHVAIAVFFVIVVVGGLIANIIFPGGNLKAANGNWSQTTFAGTGDGTYTSVKPANSNTSLGLDSNLAFAANYDGTDYNATYARGSSTATTSGTVSKPTGYNGTGSAAYVEESTTNLAPSANVSNIDTSTLGWSYDGLTIARTTSSPTPYQGTGCLRVTNSVASGDKYAMTTTDAAITAGQTYTFSAYVNIPVNLGDSGFWLRIIQFSGATPVADNSLWTTQRLVTSGWERVSESFVAVTGATTVEFRIENIGVGSVYVDALQLEAKPYPTTWTFGQTTRPGGSISYPTSNNLTTSSGTIEMWVNVSVALKSRNMHRYLFSHTTNINSPYPNTLAIRYTATNGLWEAWTTNASGSSSSVTIADTSLPGGGLSFGWHHFAMTWDSAFLKFYIDGQSVGTPSPNPYLPSALASSFYVGSWASGATMWSTAAIDGFSVYNTAKSADLIMADYNAGTQFGSEVYVSSGNFKSTAISPTGLYDNWGTLTWNATTNDQTITVDVLNGSDDVAILSDVASGTNLNLSTATYPSLKLKANLSTSSPTASPLLNDWSLGYSYDIDLPTAPTNLLATPSGATQLSVSWSASTDIGSSAAPNESTLRYDVERAPDDAGSPGVWGEAGGSCSGFVAETSCTDSGLSANTKYWYKVRARDAVGNLSSFLGETGTLVDAGFEGRADGTILDAGLWSTFGTPQNQEYDTATAKIGGSSLYIKGPTIAGYAGPRTTADWNLNANNSEARFWLNLDTTNQYRVITDLSTNETHYLLFSSDGALQVYTQRVKTGYTQNGYTTLENYSTGWTQYRIIYNFTNSTYKLYKRTTVAGSWTPLKSSGAVDYDIPMRAPVGSEPTQMTNIFFRAYQNTNLWLDDIRYSNTEITEGTAVATLANAPVLNGVMTPTNDSTPDITGASTSPNVTVKLYKNNGVETEIGSTIADGTGAFVFTNANYTSSLDEGTNTIYAKALNMYNSPNQSSSQTLTLDANAPSAPSTMEAAKSDSDTGADITNNAWNLHNDGSAVYFSWSGATDDLSGIKRYWVYFGPLAGAIPRIDGQATADATASSIKTLGTPVTGTDYYLRIQTEDNAGNISSDASIPTLFTYKFDDVEPSLPDYVSPNPAGWSISNSYSFSWPAATDITSGLYGYEYKRDNGSDDWTYTPNLSIANIQAYQNGINHFLLRVVDNAGNRTTDDSASDLVNVPYYYSDPSAVVPQNLQVDLSQSVGGTVNRFKFTWDAVQDAVRYYYSVNETPTLTSTTVTDNFTGFGAFATRQEQNTFYLVAETGAGVANWTNPATVTFSLNTVDPSAPTDLSISDVSNKATNQFALTIMWLEPDNTTPDFSDYVVQRSTDGVIFTQRATIDKTNKGYLDASVNEGSQYYYRVLAMDNVGNMSPPSEAISKIPTGKYTIAPAYTSDPEVSIKAGSATISWTTNRSSNTIVQYGPTESYGQTQGDFNNYTTDHSYELQGLAPGTTYHFRVQSLDQGSMVDYDYGTAYSVDYTFTTLAAPGISEVNVPEVGLTSAVITWKTTSSATSKILYGESSGYGQVYEDESGSQTTTHTVRIGDLRDSTTYNFKIQGLDIDGNVLASDNYVFTTLTFPVITNLRIEQVLNTPTSTIRVTFDSNVPLTSRVVVGSKEVSSYKFSQSHSLVINGLKDNTSYVASASGRDKYGNEARALTQGYKTDFDTRAPQISNLVSESEVVSSGTDKGQVIISWETDEPSMSQIEYGAGSSGDYSNKTPLDTTLTNSHAVVISGLKTSSAYHFRVISADESGNEGKSDSNTILTPEANRSIFDEILTALEKAIGWLFR